MPGDRARELVVPAIPSPIGGLVLTRTHFHGLADHDAHLALRKIHRNRALHAVKAGPLVERAALDTCASEGWSAMQMISKRGKSMCRLCLPKHLNRSACTRLSRQIRLQRSHQEVRHVETSSDTIIVHVAWLRLRTGVILEAGSRDLAAHRDRRGRA